MSTSCKSSDVPELAANPGQQARLEAVASSLCWAQSPPPCHRIMHHLTPHKRQDKNDGLWHRAFQLPLPEGEGTAQVLLG